MLRLKSVQCIVDRDQVFVRCVVGNLEAGPIEALSSATPLEPVLVARPVDEDSPHRFGRGGEEMAATLPSLWRVDVNKPQVCLVYQGRGLERLARRLVCQFLRGQSAQFVVDQRQELFSGLRIALFNCRQNLRDLAQDAPPMDVNPENFVRIAKCCAKRTVNLGAITAILVVALSGRN